MRRLAFFVAEEEKAIRSYSQDGWHCLPRTSNTQLSGEDAEDQNVIHILTAGDSSERPEGVTSTVCYVAGGTLLDHSA